MPFANQHSFRIVNPERFEQNSFKRKNIANGIDIIIGILKGKTATTVQTYRFNSNKFSFEEAKKWIKEHNIKSISQEKSTGNKEDNIEYKIVPCIRYDEGKLSKVKKHDKGFITALGSISRVGIQNYYDEQGKLVRELRLPEDVFDKESLESFNNIPVTDDHPRVVVNSKNAKRYQCGLTHDKSRRNNDFVENEITLTDAELIQKVIDGKSELSLGYECNLEFKSGDHPIYGKYDAIQRNIRGNHLAIVDFARAGRNAKLHLDSVNNAIFNNQNIKQMEKLKINDKEFEVEKEVCDSVNKALLEAKKSSDAENEKLKAENEKLKKEKEKEMKDKKDSEKEDSELEKEIKSLKEKLDALQKSIPQKVKEYSKVMDTAKSILTKEEIKNLDGKSLIDIKKEALKKFLEDEDISEKEDSYISVRFDMLGEDLKKKADSDEKLGSFFNKINHQKTDSEKELEKERKDSVDKITNNWKGKK